MTVSVHLAPSATPVQSLESAMNARKGITLGKFKLLKLKPKVASTVHKTIQASVLTVMLVSA